jgi:catabolite regulation protein CreA
VKTWRHITLLVLAGLLVAAGAHALNRSPLFWESETAADGVTVRRLSDPEAGVYCYMATSAGQIRGYAVGKTKHAAISCVKVR